MFVTAFRQNKNLKELIRSNKIEKNKVKKGKHRKKTRQMLSITDKFKVTLLQAITKNNHPKTSQKKYMRYSTTSTVQAATFDGVHFM